MHKSIFIWISNAGILVVDCRLSARLSDGGGQVTSSFLLIHPFLVFFMVRNIKIGLERFEKVSSRECDAVESFVIALILNNFVFVGGSFLRFNKIQSLLDSSPRLLC